MPSFFSTIKKEKYHYWRTKNEIKYYGINTIIKENILKLFIMVIFQ
jgi:hypothetical protein